MTSEFVKSIALYRRTYSGRMASDASTIKTYWFEHATFSKQKLE